MIGQEKGENIKHLSERNYVVFDLETTGLDAENDRIVEIGAVRVKNGEVVAEFSTLVNPECIIPQEVSELHGITNEMTDDAPKIQEALRMFDDFIGDYLLVGQNIENFDLKFIWRDSLASFNNVIANDYTDNLEIARGVLPELESHSMRNLCTLFNIDQSGAHRALNDSLMTYAVFEILKKIKEMQIKI